MNHNVKIIAAMSKNKVIGFNNRIPWKVPDEMKHFKETTTGNIVVMGHTTYYHTGVLPDRLKIVLTKNTNYTYIPDSTVIFVNSLEQCFECIRVVQCGEYKHSDIYVMGGEQIYRLFEPYANEIILSEIPTEIEGDAYFPINVKDDTKWKLDLVEYRIQYTLRKYFKIDK
jgi:dihydrofolate reductase